MAYFVPRLAAEDFLLRPNHRAMCRTLEQIRKNKSAAKAPKFACFCRTKNRWVSKAASCQCVDRLPTCVFIGSSHVKCEKRDDGEGRGLGWSQSPTSCSLVKSESIAERRVLDAFFFDVFLIIIFYGTFYGWCLVESELLVFFSNLFCFGVLLFLACAWDWLFFCASANPRYHLHLVFQMPQTCNEAFLPRTCGTHSKMPPLAMNERSRLLTLGHRWLHVRDPKSQRGKIHLEAPPLACHALWPIRTHAKSIWNAARRWIFWRMGRQVTS